MTQTGIGGDDKCGIYAALRCLHELDHCKVALFTDEEIGCRGSYDADMKFFKDCRYVLQADRRGHADFVTDISGPLASQAFHKALAPYRKLHGLHRCTGAMTDVMALRDNEVGISVANMSAGYYNPHCDDEYIDLRALDNICDFMLSVCRNITQTFPFLEKKRKDVYSRRRGGRPAGTSITTYDFSQPNTYPKDKDPFPGYTPKSRYPVGLTESEYIEYSGMTEEERAVHFPDDDEDFTGKTYGIKDLEDDFDEFKFAPGSNWTRSDEELFRMIQQQHQT